MKKRLIGLLMALALCLGLLPVTALAEGTAPQTLYVGSTTISAGYWTSSDGGTTWARQENQPEGNNYIYYDGQGTLKLHNATIQGGSITGSAPFGSGIYALSSSNQPVALTIELIGTNTITGTYGIFLNAGISADSNGTDASLTITSENNGSLGVSGSNHGIFVISGTGNASLNIEKATVTSSTVGEYAAGVCVQSGAIATGTPNISLAVDGGSLTASGTGSSDGILFYVGSSQATGATTSLTVSENAIVDARNGGISALKILETLPTPTPTGDNRSGIVFDGSTGTVYGTVALQNDLTIGEGESLTIGDGASLTVPDGKTLTNNGTVTVEEGGTLTNNGSLDCNHHTGGTATCTEKAKCDLCGAEFGDFLPHSLTKTEAKAPTCTEEGNEAYWTCGTCGKYFSDASGDTEIAKDSWILSAINHDWNDAVYIWSDNGSTCTATRTCKHDSAHTETAVATVTAAQTKAPTCTENGETTYTATFEADWAVTQTKVLTDIPAAGHSLTKTEAIAPTCTEAGNQAYWTCGTCGKLFADAEGKTEITLDSTVLPALGHDYKDGVCARCHGKDPDYVPPTDPKAPAQTGETGNPVLWIFLMALSLASIAVMAVLRREKHRA